MPGKHQFASEAQHRLFRAKAARGEIPQSAVEKRVKATEKAKGSIKALPEKVSSEPGMFFGNRQSEDGMFFKKAQLSEVVKKQDPSLKEQVKNLVKKPKQKFTPPKPRTGDVRPGEGKPKPPPAFGKKPDEMTSASMGVGCMKKKANVQLGYPGTGLSGSAPMGSTPAAAGLGQSTAMGVGKKPKPSFATVKSTLAKKAEMDKEAFGKEDLEEAAKKAKGAASGVVEAVKKSLAPVGRQAARTGESLVEGGKKTLKAIPGYMETGLASVEKLPPEARAAILAGLGYGTYRVGKGAVKKTGRGIKRIFKGKPKPKPGMLSKVMKYVRKLRGR